MKIKNKIYFEYTFFFIIIFFFYIISYLNKFPESFFFSSGDVYTLLDYNLINQKNIGIWRLENFGSVDTDYIWKHFYNLIFFLKINNLFTIDQIIKFIFFILSFFSFYLSLNLLDINLNKKIKVILSLSYCFNFFVFFLFWYTWGYTPTFFIYCFLPLLVCSYIKFYKSKSIKSKINSLLISIIIIFFSNIAFANLAYYLIVNFFLLCITIYFIICENENKIKIKNIIYYFGYTLIFFILSLPSIFPSLISVFDISYNSTGYDLSSYIIGQAQILPGIFFMSNHVFNVKTMYNFQFLSILNFIIFFYFIKNKLYEKKLGKFIIYFIFLIIIISFKGVGFMPMESISNFFTKNILYVFRSEDKSSFLIPFLLLIFFAISLERFKEKLKLKISLVILIINILSSYPLILGGIQTKHGLLINKNQTYEDSDYSMIKKLPADYSKIISYLNNLSSNEQTLYNVLDFPSHISSSMGWSKYSALKHHGVSPYDHLIKFQVLNMNSDQDVFLKDNFNTANFFSNNKSMKLWDINFLRQNSIKYIIVHKDIDSREYVNSIYEKILSMINHENIEVIFNTKNLILLKNNDDNLKQKIFLPKYIVSGFLYNNYINFINKIKEDDKKIDTFLWRNSKNKFSETSLNINLFFNEEELEIINNVKKDINGLKTKINNLKKQNNFYTFDIETNDKDFQIFFNQKYNFGWMLDCIDCNKNIKIKKNNSNFNINSWKVINNSETPIKLNFKIYYIFNDIYDYILKSIMGIIIFIFLICLIFKKKNL
jgi:hypothetical protein